MKQQASILLIARAYGSLAQAFLLVLVARSTLPGTFGLLNVILSSGAVALFVLDFGMASFVIRERASGNNANLRGALRLNRRTTFIGALAGSGLILLVTGHERVPGALVLLAISLAIEKNVDTTLGVAVADRRILIPCLSILLRRSVAVGLYLLLAHFGIDSITAFSWASVIGAMTCGVHIALWSPAIEGQSAPLSGVARRGVPFMVATVTTQARMLDAVIVKIFLGNSAAGLYAAASRLSMPFMLVSATLANVLVPHSVQSRIERVKKSARQMTIATILGQLVCFPIFFLFSSEIIIFILGDSYEGASEILPWIIMAIFPLSLSPPLASLLQGRGKEILVARIGIVFILICLLGVTLAAIFAGTVLVAIVVAMSFWVKSFVLLYYIEKLIEFNATDSSPELLASRATDAREV